MTDNARFGTAMGARGEVVLQMNEEFQETGIEEILLLRYLPEMAFSWSAGAGTERINMSHFAWGIAVTTFLW